MHNRNAFWMHSPFLACTALLLCLAGCMLTSNPVYAQGRTLGVPGGQNGSGAERVALVIGNRNNLKNPAHDAEAISKILKQLGFEVLLALDLNRDKMEKVTEQFKAKLSPNTAALFYYAGHGVQSQGLNYLIPEGAKITKEEELSANAFAFQKVLDAIGAAKNGCKFVILDACRKNPFPGGEALPKGLAEVKAPSETLIAFSTSPGETASDGVDEEHSPYTAELLKQLVDSDLKAEEVFKLTGAEVQKRTKGDQVPWVSTSITQDFHFSKREAYYLSDHLTTASSTSGSIEFGKQTYKHSFKFSRGWLGWYIDKLPDTYKRFTVTVGLPKTTQLNKATVWVTKIPKEGSEVHARDNIVLLPGQTVTFSLPLSEEILALKFYGPKDVWWGDARLEK